MKFKREIQWLKDLTEYFKILKVSLAKSITRFIKEPMNESDNWNNYK